jgi:hypothetical protein
MAVVGFPKAVCLPGFFLNICRQLVKGFSEFIGQN